MKVNVLHILLIVFISGVIGLDKRPLHDNDGPSINGKNTTDIPPVSTVPSTDKPTTTPTTTTTATTTTTTSTTPNSTTTSTTTVKPDTTTPKTTPTTVTTPKTTSVTSSTESTTLVPTPTAAPHKDRRFDGPSFIGGIILAAGLMAIGFVSWKFYKARTERNYHTL